MIDRVITFKSTSELIADKIKNELNELGVTEND